MSDFHSLNIWLSVHPELVVAALRQLSRDRR
jgi:hypothetical protein